MDYLGLGPDDAYDDYDDHDEPEAPRHSAPPRTSDTHARSRDGEPEPEPTVRTVSGPPELPVARTSTVAVAAQAPNSTGSSDDSGVQTRPQPVVAARAAQCSREVPWSRRRCGPRRFDQAQEVADKFKEGQPVIMNLEGAEREVARRLIDFASGICYALDGSMEKVATGVYLLKPPSRRDRASRYDDPTS